MDKNRLAVRPKEAAKLLGISQRTLWSLSSPRGPIPCARIGRVTLYPVDRLRRWLLERAQPPANGQGDDVAAEVPAMTEGGEE